MNLIVLSHLESIYVRNGAIYLITSYSLTLSTAHV